MRDAGTMTRVKSRQTKAENTIVELRQKTSVRIVTDVIAVTFVTPMTFVTCVTFITFLELSTCAFHKWNMWCSQHMWNM